MAFTHEELTKRDQARGIPSGHPELDKGIDERMYEMGAPEKLPTRTKNALVRYQCGPKGDPAIREHIMDRFYDEGETAKERGWVDANGTWMSVGATYHMSRAMGGGFPRIRNIGSMSRNYLNEIVNDSFVREPAEQFYRTHEKPMGGIQL